MAGAVAVVGLVASIASLTRTSEVPESFRSLEKRLPLLTSTLRFIQQQVGAERLSAEVSTALRSLIRDTLTQLKVVENCLLKIIPPSDASHLHRAIKALQSLTKDRDIRVAIERIHQESILPSCIDASDQILAALARLELGQAQAPSTSPHRGHSFGNVAVNDHASVQLGDIYYVHQHSEPDTLKVFGLCLTSAPLIEPDSFVGRVREPEEMSQGLQPGQPAAEQRRVVLGGLGKMQLWLPFPS